MLGLLRYPYAPELLPSPHLVFSEQALYVSADVSNDKIHKDLMEFVIKPVVPAKYLDDKTIFHLNPSGRYSPRQPCTYAVIPFTVQAWSHQCSVLLSEPSG